MPHLAYKIKINAAPQKVWDILADFGNIYRWSPLVKASHSTSANNGGLGATRQCEFSPMGAVRERVIGWKTGQSIDIELTQFKTMPLKGGHATFSVSPEGEGSWVTLHYRYEMKFGLLGSVLHGLMKSFIHDGMKGTLAGLKRYAETGEEVHTTQGLRVEVLPA